MAFILFTSNIVTYLCIVFHSSLEIIFLPMYLTMPVDLWIMDNGQASALPL